MTRLASALSPIALLAAAPAGAQAARDFQLPPAATPTADTRVQGPVDADAPAPIRPRAIETAPPATPTPTASSTPAIVLPEPTAARATPAARGSAPRELERARRTAPLSPGNPLPPAALQSPLPDEVAPSPPPVPSTAPAGPSGARPAAAGDPPLPWAAMVAGVLALAAAAIVLLRRRRAKPAPPHILAPPAQDGPGAAVEALALSVEAIRLDRSVLNATVGYRVTLRNRSGGTLSGLAVEADLVSASGDRPAEQQLASPGLALTPRHHAERLAPGQSLRFEGQARLPLAEAGAIWQGRVGLLVPLLRIRATASGAAAVATTLVIGRAEGQASRPQPFRLDEPPRSYAPVAQRALDGLPSRA